MDENVFYEAKAIGNPYRQNYADGIDRLIEARYQALVPARDRFMTPEKLKADPEYYRRQLMDLFGWPLNAGPSGTIPAFRRTFVEERAGCRLWRLEIEALAGLWFYGLLFVPKAPGRHPLILSQHGGGGSPELCSDMNGNNNYNHMTMRVVERDAVVFAPQLLLWNSAPEDKPTFPGYGIQYNRMETDMRLRQLGGSMTALELTCLKRSLDYLLTLPEVDAGHVGMLGLSYGGMFSILLPAVETRIRASYSCCYFTGYKQYHILDMFWQNAALSFMNAEIAALVAPRALYIEVGEDDQVLPPQEEAYAEYLRIRPFFAAQDAGGRLVFNKTKEGHKIDRTDLGLDFLFAHL